MTAQNLNAVADAIRAAKRIALCCHVSPDGDAVGSTLALRMGVEALGKEVICFCQDKVPDNLRMLRGAEDFRAPEDAAGQQFDLLVTVDVADMRRMGRCASLLEAAAATAQVDHHGTNPAYMQVNYIDEKAPSSAVIIRRLLALLGVPVTREIAMCLYAGMSTDTGNFAFSSTDAETFSVMSELMDAGLPLNDMNRRLFRERSVPQILLLARALGSLRFYREGRISMMTLSRQDMIDCGALPEHADAIVNFGLDVTGVKLAALLRESPDGTVKCSLRAIDGGAVDGVAASFGGGGHRLAAGATLAGPLDDAAARMLTALENALDGVNA
ncbi:MAG: bifunctional oligoribonuclease/PAP phosphatase NrnA [Clostridia bacterium]|nr:bifunctional oligoribonuclease/PAP phosphatase NrnA [Clostridia bacterium]